MSDPFFPLLQPRFKVTEKPTLSPPQKDRTCSAPQMGEMLDLVGSSGLGVRQLSRVQKKLLTQKARQFVSD
jgi:hypothetical protein